MNADFRTQPPRHSISAQQFVFLIGSQVGLGVQMQSLGWADFGKPLQKHPRISWASLWQLLRVRTQSG